MERQKKVAAENRALEMLKPEPEPEIFDMTLERPSASSLSVRQDAHSLLCQCSSCQQTPMVSQSSKQSCNVITLMT